jgi:glycosyltransferase involved in cell wall biosynthesis
VLLQVLVTEGAVACPEFWEFRKCGRMRYGTTVERMHPTISVVIPTFNRQNHLRACLESLKFIRYPAGRFEIIVIDDGSQESIKALVDSFRDFFPVHVIAQANTGPANARNRGLEAAAGELIAFTDDDCRPCPEWLEELAKGFNTHPQAAFGGRVVNARPHNLYCRASQQLVDYLRQYYRPQETGRGFFTSNNLAFPTNALRSIGGFNGNFPRAAAEDRELCERWNRAGGRMIYLPAARVDHWHQLSLPKFARQHFEYGRGAWIYHKVRADYAKRHIQVEPLSFYWRLITHPFRTLETKPLASAALLTLSQAANASGFFYQQFFGQRRISEAECSGYSSNQRA